MVTKIISGILGRKSEDKKEPKPSDDVPDELPPLAEEIVSGTSQSKSSSKEQVKAPEMPVSRKEEPKVQEVPDELPPLSTDGLSTMPDSKEEGTLEDLEKEGIPDAIKKAKLAKAKSSSAPEPIYEKPASSVEIPQRIPLPDKIITSPTTRERITSGSETGFFSNLLEHIRTSEGAKEKLLAGDLFSRMDNYWEIRRHEIKSGVKMPQEKKLEDDMLKKLEELKELEQKWQVQKLSLEEDLKFLHQREREIQIKIEELKLMSNELNLFRLVKPEEYFHMNNGVVLKSLHDLIDILEVVDEETYHHHVNDYKNDFATWVLNIFKDKNLSMALKKARTRAAMIEALETIPIMSDEIEKSSAYSMANPKQYLWLENGVVIRNLFELCESLKSMDDELFLKHVTETRNDFAKWARDALKNNHLSEKLASASNRQEMVKVLEVFL